MIKLQLFLFLFFTQSKSLPATDSEATNTSIISNSRAFLINEKVITPSSEASSSLSSNSNKPISSSPEMFKLFEVLNSTLLNIDTIIVDTMRNASLKGQKDFDRIGGILRNVQTFLNNQSDILSQDATSQIEKSIQNIQIFFRDHNKQLQNHISNMRNSNLTTVDKASIGNNNKSEVGEGTTSRQASSSITNTNNNNVVENLAEISSKVGEGIRSTATGAQNILTTSINQIQTQIQTFLNGINQLFSSAGTTLNIPNLFNLTLPQVQST